MVETGAKGNHRTECTSRTQNEQGPRFFLLCINIERSPRIWTLIIGRANRPRCFQCRDAVEMGWGYTVSGRAWMNTSSFINGCSGVMLLLLLPGGRVCCCSITRPLMVIFHLCQYFHLSILTLCQKNYCHTATHGRKGDSMRKEEA